MPDCCACSDGMYSEDDFENPDGEYVRFDDVMSVFNDIAEYIKNKTGIEIQFQTEWK